MIRYGTTADRQAVAALQETALSSPAPELLDLALGSDAATLLVALDDGLAGYALAVPGDRAADPPVVYVAEVVVAPGARREGYGSTLLDAVADRFADYDQLRLTARADENGPLRFYRENGFATRARLPDHYDDGDGVLLVRDL